MFSIKSISDEGEYYLVNHWYKYKSFWQHKNDLSLDSTFINAKDAKTSLTKLLKTMPEYGRDTFTLVWVYSVISPNGVHMETKDLYELR